MTAKWTRKYLTITTFEADSEHIFACFADGDEVRLASGHVIPDGVTDIQWKKAALSNETGHITIPAYPRALEIPGYFIRTLSDTEFASHMAKLAEEQSRFIGRRIRALREKRDLSQTKLASIAGINQANLSRIESGVYDVSTSTLWKLLGAMGCSAGDLAE